MPGILKKKLLLSLTSLVCCLMLAEIAWRVVNHETSTTNYLLENIDFYRSAYPVAFDPDLGWVPRIGKSSENIWQTSITILEDTTRSNGEHSLARDTVPQKKHILVVGDSFTFGDQVSDHETWPALLEQISQQPVINGGVCGYGIDQSYLRLMQLLERMDPGVIIFSFIPNDISRASLSVRTSVAKPYFILSEEKTLILQDNHLPERLPSPKVGFIRGLLGHSFLAHTLASKAFPEWWLLGTEWRSESANNNSVGVSQAIMRELNRLAQTREIEVYVLVQYPKESNPNQRRVVKRVTDVADPERVRVINLHEPLMEVKEQDPERYERFYKGHMTPEGNAFVARILWDALNGTTKSP